ncbi:MAG TPA: glycosyltransferase family 4 protein [Candidatus Methylomirabilis sp.]|nr:glycosyltransferase family 4 protein [Candidatus Methylomirabilis sp.]
MRPKKIAILAERMLPGSIPKVTGNEAQYFNKFGYDTEVLTILDGGLPEESYQFQQFLKNVKIRELSHERSMIKKFDFKLPFFSFLSGYHLASPFLTHKAIKKSEYDLIIGLNSIVCLTAYQIARNCKIPYVACMWDPMSYIFPKVYSDKFPEPIFSLMLKAAQVMDKFLVEKSLVTLTLSEAHAEQLRALSDAANIEVVYYGCYPVENIPEKRGDYVLAIDRWDKGNQPHLLLDVLQKVKKGTKLIVAGFWSEDWILQSFKKAIEEKGMKDQVEITGPVSESRLKELYLNARVWVHPIEETSFSMPAIEAASHGCPVIAPQGIPLLKHGVHGYFPPLNDTDQYAEFLNKLICDERLAWELGRNGWNLAKEYTWEKHAQQMDLVIKKYIQ